MAQTYQPLMHIIYYLKTVVIPCFSVVLFHNLDSMIDKIMDAHNSFPVERLNIIILLYLLTKTEFPAGLWIVCVCLVSEQTQQASTIPSASIKSFSRV